MLFVTACALVVAGCVLKHPSNPATSGADQWFKQHGDAARLLMTTALVVTTPPQNIGVAAYDEACAALQSRAQAAQKLPPIPSKTLQFQWQSGLKFFELGGTDCLASIANTDPSKWQNNNTLRDTARDDVTFGQIRLQSVMTALGSNANPLPQGVQMPGRTIPLK